MKINITQYRNTTSNTNTSFKGTINPNTLHEIFVPQKKIKFVKATSIEEAKLYAKKVLGIQTFCVDNIFVANWLNQGLKIIHNMYNGELPRPKKISYDSSKLIPQHNQTYFIPANKEIGANKRFAQKYLDAEIKECIGDWSLGEDGLVPILDYKLMKHLNNFIQLFNDNKLTIPAKYRLLNILEQYKEIAYNNLYGKHIEKNISNYLKVLNEYRTSNNLPEKQLKPEFSLLPQRTKAYILKTIIEELNSFKHEPKEGFHKLSNYFFNLFHEVGHFLHYAPLRPNEIKFLEKASFNAKETNIVSVHIGDCAAESPVEFVAEVFAQCISGKEPPKSIMELYKKFKGPKLPTSLQSNQH